MRVNGNSDYLFLFGDLIGSTEVASEASPELYSQFYLGSYHLSISSAEKYMHEFIFPDLQDKQIIENIRITGDEVLSFTKVSYTNPTELSNLIGSALAFSLALKLCWLASPYNLLRISEGKFPRDIAIGIHMGPAVPIVKKGYSDIAGLHINVTKRLESVARAAQQSRIFTSGDIEKYFKIWLARIANVNPDSAAPLMFTDLVYQPTGLDLKGIPVKISPYELQMSNLSQEASSQFVKLTSLVYETPQKVDIRSEDAVTKICQIMIDKLDDDSDLLQFCNVTSSKDYIDLWFEAIRTVPHIFFNDLWTVLMAFFISCGYIRTSNCEQESIKTYQDISKEIQERLISIINRENNR